MPLVSRRRQQAAPLDWRLELVFMLQSNGQFWYRRYVYIQPLFLSCRHHPRLFRKQLADWVGGCGFEPIIEALLPLLQSDRRLRALKSPSWLVL